MKYTFFTVSIIFLFFNILFNFRFVQQLISNDPLDHIAKGESALAEFTLENSYQNILRLKNPYFLSGSFLYPYESNLSLNDPGTANIIFYFFLRPFFDIHTSMLIILLLNSYLTSMLMFTLLRKLGARLDLSILFSLSFSFTPYISYRILGHYIYTSLYIFPLAFLILHLFFAAKASKRKILLSLLFGVLLAFILMLNLYYFLTFILLFTSYSLYYLVSNRKYFASQAFKLIPYLLITLLSFVVISSPLSYAVIQLLRFEGLSKTPGLGGAQVLSADVLSFITPSEYNPIYNFLISLLAPVSSLFSKLKHFYLNGWDKFAYPGIIILICYFIFLKAKKSLPKDLIGKISAPFTVSLFFAILLLGPFLKIFNRWSLPIEEGIYLEFPLPFLLFHFLPGLNTVRAPTRFLPAFVFLASIVGALLLTHLYKRYHNRRAVFTIILFAIFIIDQIYIIPKPPNTYIPLASYKYIKSDPGYFSVLEIPFTVRDGFNYLGFVHAINPLAGALIHQKPVIGGYTARVHPAVFSYYRELPFIGYVSQIIDKGNYNPDKENPREVNIFPYPSDIMLAKKELDFLDIKYVLLKNNEKYSPYIRKLISDLGFKSRLADGEYDLYERQPDNLDFSQVVFSATDDYLYTGQGFSIREAGFRWTEGNLAKVFLKTRDISRTRLILESASFYKPQDAEVYFNGFQVGKKIIGVEKTRLGFDVSGKIKPGINTVIIRFSQNIKPSDVIPNEKDSRNLAAQLFLLKIE